jgi:proton-dependent oligopeptide transporter, POT family
VGLSTVTKLAPQRMVGQMMGVWFLAISLGGFVAGRAGGQFETMPLPQLFGIVAAVGIGAGLLLALVAHPMRRLMAGVH